MECGCPSEPAEALVHFFKGVEVMRTELNLANLRAVPVVPALHATNRAPEVGREGATDVDVRYLVAGKVAGGDCMSVRGSNVTGAHGGRSLS